MKRIYLDYASLTPIDPRVLRETRRYSSPEYANPSSIYEEGVAAKKALEDARKRVAGIIRAHANEIIFTGGGTEANNSAVEGVLRTAWKTLGQKPHLIISNIEHSSVMEMARVSEGIGCEVTRIPVGTNGMIDPNELKKAIRPNTALVSIMTVNNEIGTIQPVREIAKVIRWCRANVTKSSYPIFHTDAAQAVYGDLNVEKLGVDLMTLDGGKMFGPRGVGALYVKRGTPIEAVSVGGGQEKGLRSGTENVPAIMGFAKAFELVSNGREKEAMRLNQLKEGFLTESLDIRSDIKVNPEKAPISPHILNVSIPGIDNEFFTLQLDAKGVAVSTKSSCLKDEDGSYVLKAIGADSKTAIRFSFGRWTKKSDLSKVIRKIKEILHS